MQVPVSVIIPAHNEADTIEAVVCKLRSLSWVDEIVVVDNASDDDTGALAEKAGARAVREMARGMGHAVRAGLKAARNDWVMKLDADLERFDTALFAEMPAARAEGVGLVKGAWNDPNDNMPMTRLLVAPAIRQMFPGLNHLRAPNSGIYLVDRRWIAHQELVGGYAADLDVMLRVHASGAKVVEVEIGRIVHDARNLAHYNAMAEVIMAFFLEQQIRRISQELVVFAKDATQVIETALGALARRSLAGGPVTVFLDDLNAPAARVLQDALAAFPTARFVALDEAGGFQPANPEGETLLFAPYPFAQNKQAIRAALNVQDTLNVTPELILMPMIEDSPGLRSFRPDVSLEVGNGADIKRRALADLAQTAQPTSGLDVLREVFQTFDSLPDPLRIQLRPEPKTDAGNL
ncbi:MAG: glycosyltransferase family 2 protein [Pseudomonadota bacterium]